MLFTRKYDYSHIEVHKKGKGYPLLLVHGLNSSSDTWKSTLSYFKKGFAVHLIKIKGFDGITAPDTPSLKGVRDDIIAHIEDNNLHKPVIAGHSLGGFLSLWTATAYQNIGLLLILDSLPFMGAALNPYLNSLTAMPYASYLKRKVLRIDTREKWRSWQHSTLKDMVTEDKNLKLALDWSMKADKKMTAEAIEGLFSIDLRGAMNRITQPTLVLASWKGYAHYGFSKNDILQIFNRQYSLLKHKKIIMAEDAKHYLMLDDPKWTVIEVKRFLDEYVTRSFFQRRIFVNS